VPIAGNNLIITTKVTFYGFSFGRGLDNDKVFRHKNYLFFELLSPIWNAKNRGLRFLFQINKKYALRFGGIFEEYFFYSKPLIR
jgi:hypothetical protein